MFSLFDKNNVFSNRCDNNSCFTIKNEINTIVPIIPREAAKLTEATVVVTPAAVVVVETTVVVVVVVTVVIISSPYHICNA